jgi:sterol desaturase/sphingolipid hydroxylase (fatty acid hydroxylase superfamily)
MVEVEDNSKSSLLDFNCDKLIKYEMRKYNNKGYWLILAWVIAISYIYIFPNWLKFIWPEKVQNPGHFYAIVTYLTFNSLLILVNLEYLIIYKLAHPFFEQYKTTPDPWPWQVDKEKWIQQLKKSFIRVFFNNFILLPIFLIPDLINNTCPLRLDIETLPSYREMLLHMAICMITEDFLFYLSHRLLHNGIFYSKIHKVHHEYIESVSISATYSHFVEYILGNILPSSVAPLILGQKMHFLTYLVYIVMVLHESHDGHSGYNFPWCPHRVIPFTFDSEFHIFHHWKYNGNYANYLSIWDRFFGTVNKVYINYVDHKEKFMKKYSDKTRKNNLENESIKED